MIELVKQENGHLMIKLVDREDVAELLDKHDNESATVTDMLDSGGYLGNDWHVPEDIGLTEAPAIGQGAIYNDNEEEPEILDFENLWYYPEYMVKNFVEELLDQGFVIFVQSL